MAYSSQLKCAQGLVWLCNPASSSVRTGPGMAYSSQLKCSHRAWCGFVLQQAQVCRQGLVWLLLQLALMCGQGLYGFVLQPAEVCVSVPFLQNWHALHTTGEVIRELVITQ